MKYSLIILTLLTCSSVMGQRQKPFEEPTIQNFYKVCNAEKYTAFNLVNTGIQLFGSRQYSRSLNKFSSALEKDSELCDAWYLTGYAHQQLGEHQKSIEACNKSLEMNSNNVSAYIINAYNYILLNDTTTALTNFEKAKELNPKLIDSYYGIALLNYWQGNSSAVTTEFSNFQANKSEEVSKMDIRTFEKLVEKASQPKN